MLIETNPGSRLKTCDVCGDQWIESSPGHFSPGFSLPARREMADEACDECAGRWKTFIRRHLKRSLWADFGLEDSE